MEIYNGQYAKEGEKTLSEIALTVAPSSLRRFGRTGIFTQSPWYSTETGLIIAPAKAVREQRKQLKLHTSESIVEFLQGKDLISPKLIETKIGAPVGTIQKAMDGVKPIPKKWLINIVIALFKYGIEHAYYTKAQRENNWEQFLNRIK